MNNDFQYSFAALAAGVHYSPTYAYNDGGPIDRMETTLDLTTLGGTGTVDCLPQYSYDNVTFFDHVTSFTQLSAAGSETLNLTTTGLFMRWKITVTAGSTPLATGKLYAIAK